MSFRIPATAGLRTIRAGGAIGVKYRLSGGSDFGAQFAMADSHAVPILTTFNQGKVLEADGSTSYLVTVRNASAVDIVGWDLIGGGIT